jgi:hypothetical protein
MHLKTLYKIHTYIAATMAYGFAHALPRAYKLKHEYVTDKLTDALVTDKVAHCCHSASISPILWPWYLATDMRAIEIFARGKRADEFPGNGFT